MALREYADAQTTRFITCTPLQREYDVRIKEALDARNEKRHLLTQIQTIMSQEANTGLLKLERSKNERMQALRDDLHMVNTTGKYRVAMLDRLFLETVFRQLDERKYFDGSWKCDCEED